MNAEAHPDPSPQPPARRGFGGGALIVVALLSAAVAAGVVLRLARPGVAGTAQGSADPPQARFTCPMHPSIVRDHPGECPICGMQLVKVDETKSASQGQATVEIDPARQQLIGLRTVTVTAGPVGGAWRTVGRVAMDETRIRRVNVKVSGFVERVFADFTGKAVKVGDPLFTFFSPELLAAQQEYLLALKTRGALAGGAALTGDGDALIAAARRKLSLWDVPQSTLDRLAATGEATRTLVVYSPVSGVVTKKEVVEGMKLDAGAMPYEIVDLSTVWVLADVYESELRHVKESMPATLVLNAYPDREFKGRVLFVDPVLDAKTRTVKARLAFANPTGELRPEMFGEVVLHGAPHEGLRIPADAVIDSGTEKIVFLALGQGKFEPRRVQLGDADQTHVEVVFGLKEGEEVAMRASFLIDSESRLRASLAAMSAKAGSPESARVLPAPHAEHGEAGGAHRP